MKTRSEGSDASIFGLEQIHLMVVLFNSFGITHNEFAKQKQVEFEFKTRIQINCADFLMGYPFNSAFDCDALSTPIEYSIASLALRATLLTFD